MRTLLHDLRYAVRTLSRSPATTVAAVLTLGLGVGAATTMFTGIHDLVLRPFHFPGVERAVALYEHHDQRGGERNEVSPANYLDWRKQTGSFEHLAAHLWWDCNLSGGGPAERLQGRLVGPEFFAALGVRPLLGRDFRIDEDRPERERVVILAEGLWRRRFGGDPAVLGRTLRLNGEPHVVVGVMPRTSSYPAGTELWVPLSMTPEVAAQRGNHRLLVIGRLKPGVTLEKARAEMRALAARLGREHPDTNTGWTARVYPLMEDVSHLYRSMVVMLFVAVGFVLLIACANVASLQLVRAAGRAREIAIRAAIGAGRRRIVRQLLTESVLLALVGGTLGLLLSLWGADLVRTALPEDVARLIPGWDRLGVDGTVLAFALAIGLLTSLVFGLAPALHASRCDLVGFLREGERGGEGPAGSRLRRSLVVSEVALAVLLLVGAGLMIRSLESLQRAETGFDPEHVLTLRLALPRAGYPDSARVLAFYGRTLERLRALPGVEVAAAVNHVPFGDSNSSTRFSVQGRGAPAPGQEPGARYRVVTPDYFRVLGIPLRRGRAFDARDHENAPGVVIVNEALARAHFPDLDPIGQRLRFGDENSYEIVGVVGNVKHTSVGEEPAPEVYLPHAQDPRLGMFVVIRAAPDPAPLAPAVRRIVQDIDPDVAVFRIQTLRQLMSGLPVIQQRLSAGFLTAFAGIAALIAAVGIFGVVSHAVSRRTREIGVRVALGAAPGDVRRAVLMDGLKLALLGVAIGLAAALGLSRTLQGLLFGVRPADLATYATVAVLLTVVALLACWIPARRATRVSPIVALRSE